MNTEQRIKHLMDLRMSNEIDFMQFSELAIAAGVEYMTNDLVRKQHVYYTTSGEAYVHALPSDYVFNVAPQFNKPAVLDAIAKVDANQMSPRDFVIAMGEHGVAFAHVYLKHKRVFYMGLEGDFYLEQW